MIDLKGHYGFTRLPFGKDLAPGMLHQHAAHGEAAARIAWCIREKALGVITGEVGAGKTVAARAAIAAPHHSGHGGSQPPESDIPRNCALAPRGWCPSSSAPESAGPHRRR